MKKILIFVLILSFIFTFSGCKKEKPPVLEPQSQDELLVYDVMEKFYSDEKYANCMVSDYTVATDKAEDLIGVVHYTDAANNPACVSFISNSGNTSVALEKSGGFMLVKNSKMAYLGDGKVSLLLENQQIGKVYEYTVSYKNNGENIKTDVERKLLENN